MNLSTIWPSILKIDFFFLKIFKYIYIYNIGVILLSLFIKRQLLGGNIITAVMIKWLLSHSSSRALLGGWGEEASNSTIFGYFGGVSSLSTSMRVESTSSMSISAQDKISLTKQIPFSSATVGVLMMMMMMVMSAGSKQEHQWRWDRRDGLACGNHRKD